MFSCKSQRCPFNGGVSPHGFKGWWSSSCWEGDYFSWKFFFLFWNVSKHLRHLRHFPETTFGSLTVSLWELNGPWCIPASWGCVAGYLPLACLLPRILWLEVLSVYLLFPEALRHRGQCVCVCVCVCVSEREREGRWLICILDECEFSLLPPTSGSNLQFLMSSWKGDSKTLSLIAFSFPEPTSIEVPERGPAFQSALPLGSHIFTSSLP